MRPRDVVRFAWASLASSRIRTALIVLAMSIGVAAVVVLTSLGEGARTYVMNQFRSLGVNIIVVLPGRAETFGSGASLMSGRTPRDLTLEDALALRRITGAKRVVPVNLMAGEVRVDARHRDVPVVGSTHELLLFWGLELAQGKFLPPQDPRHDTPVVVIGSNVRDEMFGARSALGQFVRIGDRRFRVIGVLAQRGEFLGLDMDEIVIMPVASAQALFNIHALLRIGVEAASRDDIEPVKREVRRVIRERHQGEEDVTLITEDAVASTFDRVLGALTLALVGIASISLAVAGILIMNVMLIAVSQRTGEIGLLKAIGASPRQISTVFLTEATLLSAAGGVSGSILGQLGSLAIRQLYPAIPAYAPLWAALAAFALAILTGVGFAILPARRAASLDPALSLARR